MVAIEKLCVDFGQTRALHSIQLSLRASETHILLGSSGSGKSTLLRALMGLVRPASGTIKINGEILTQDNHSKWIQKIGYVPQEGGLFPHLTAFQNVSLVATTLGWSKDKIENRAEELRKIVSLDREFFSRFPKQLSGGQRQRFAIMRAAFLDPDLMLLDEPLGALDPIIRSDLQRELKNIFQRLGKSVILVTHDIDEAAFLGNEITLLHEGHVIQTGTLHDLLTKPADSFVTRFISAQRRTWGGVSSP